MIEGETVSICMVGGVMKECLLSDCIPMEEIVSRAKFLKLGQYIETYQLIIARRLYKIPSTYTGSQGFEMDKEYTTFLTRYRNHVGFCTYRFIVESGGHL